jgi:hypothetical protein
MSRNARMTASLPAGSNVASARSVSLSVSAAITPSMERTTPPSTPLRRSCRTYTTSSQSPDGPGGYDRAGAIGGKGGRTKRRLAALALALAGSALLGVVAGVVWGEVAPRALLQEIARGEAEIVNAETSAFIVADAWFCLIGAVGGLLTGTLGYRFGVRRAGWIAAAGLVVGAVAASLIAMWVGENIGLGTYNHLLASSPTGTFFNASLGLGAKSALAFWPLLTSVAILLGETGARRSAPAPGTDPTGPSGMWTDGS